MNKNLDPLMSLVSDDGMAVNREKLGLALSGYIKIDATTKEIHFLPDFEKINTNLSKLEVVFLSAKARSLLYDFPESLTQTDIITMDIMPIGSVKSGIKKLFDHKKIKKDKEGKYILPGYRINELIETIQIK